MEALVRCHPPDAQARRYLLSGGTLTLERPCRGCVSGSQLVNLQEACGGDPDDLDFDAIDGFDELQ